MINVIVSNITMYKILFVLLALMSFALLGYSQEDEADIEEIFTIENNQPLTLDMEAEDTITAPLKIKTKKNQFYGLKTRKGFTTSGFGESTVIELFYYLKGTQEIDPYVRDIYWFDIKKRKIVNSRKIDWNRALLLHGPYKKMVGEQVLEEGIFYKGMKHGRWVKLNKYDILIDKEKYYKGWPKDAKISYYNPETRQVKEIIPIQHGEKEGNYYAFYENGALEVTGKYQFDQKVGIWYEFYPEKSRKKKEIQYPKDAFDEKEPVILREWDEKGKLVYDAKKNGLKN